MAFYLFVLHPPAPVVAASVVILALLTFVRTPYIYATRGAPFARTMNLGAVVWFALLGVILFGPARYSMMLAVVSLAYPAMYFVFSAMVTVRRSLRT